MLMLTALPFEEDILGGRLISILGII